MLKRSFRHSLLSVVIITPFMLYSQVPQGKKAGLNSTQSSATYRHSTLLNANAIAMSINNDGRIRQSNSFYFGLTYPRRTAALVSGDNLIWVGKVSDGRDPIIRTGGGTYFASTQPGAVLEKGVVEDAGNPSVRAYRIRKDYASTDLLYDAVDVYGVEPRDVTDEMIATVLEQYNKDEEEWPWQLGAPFEDTNGNGIMDAGEKPGFQNADQVVWFVYNDLDEWLIEDSFENPSFGLEIQATMWAYKDIPEFDEVVFKRYRFIYKGTAATSPDATIDSMYICQWVDMDIGDFSDDLAGCDSALSLGFGYNSVTPDDAYKKYTSKSPAIGHVLLQGPTVPGDADDEAVVDFSIRKGIKNLPMTAFWHHATGTGNSEPSSGYTFWFWNAARGFRPDPDDRTNNPMWYHPDGWYTKFMFSGDPTAETGWIDGLAQVWPGPPDWSFSQFPGERRIMLNTGPFTMALGDTQEVVIAIIAGLGNNGEHSVDVLKTNARVLHSIYPYLAETVGELKPPSPPAEEAVPYQYSLSQNYPNPFNPTTYINYSLPIATNVRVVVYNLLGQEVRVLEDGNKAAGEYSVAWDGRHANGLQAPSGVYILRLEASHVELSRRMVLLK